MVSSALGGRLTILRTLGSGGFADVFLAREESTRRLVALKQARTADPASSQLLAREFSLVAPLMHPGLARALDFFPGGEQKPAAIVFELLDGQISEQACREASRPEILGWAAGLAETLDFLHHLGLIHGDIKPSNLFITTDGVPRLIDFGLSGAPGHQTGGSPATAAPEVLERARADAKSDLFGFGATLFFWLFGRFPCGETLAARLASLRRRPALPHDSSLPRGLRTLLRDLLSPDPEERPASAREVANRLSAEGIHAAASLARPEARARALPLLEREGVLEELAAIADPSQSGFWALAGPEGSGRSRLLEDLARRARLAGRRVIAVSGNLGSLPGSDPALAVALHSLTEQGPAALLVDEASRIFPDGQEALLALPSRLARSSRLAVVAAFDAPPAASGWRVLHPGPLSEEGLAALVEALLPGPPAPASLIARVAAVSEGRPGIVVRLAIEAVGLGLITWTASGWDKTALEQAPLGNLLRRPTALQDLETSLTSEELSMAQCMAACGHPSSLEFLARASGLNMNQAAAAVRGLWKAGMAIRHHGGELALPARLASLWKPEADHAVDLHARLLEGWARRGPESDPERAFWLGRLARHAAGTGRLETAGRLAARGVGAALKAGRLEIAAQILAALPEPAHASAFVEAASGEIHLARGKTEPAAACFSRAAEKHAAAHRPAAAHESLLRLARARGTEGQLTLAQKALAEAGCLPSSPQSRASAALELGVLEARSGHYSQALEHMEMAVRNAIHGSALEARARAALARCLVIAGRPAEGERELAAASEAAALTKDAGLSASLVLARIQAALADHRPRFALDLAGTARRLLLERGDVDGLGLLDGLASDAARDLGLFDRALEFARQALGWREIQNHPEWLPAAQERLARIYWLLGQMSAARAMAHNAVRLSVRGVRHWESAGPLSLLARVYAADGDLSRARRCALAAVARSRRGQDMELSLEAAVSLAAVDRFAGDPSRSRQHLRESLDLLRGAEERTRALPEGLALLALAMRPEDPEGEERLARRAFDLAQRQADFDGGTLALAALAEIREAAGDEDEATRLRERIRARIDEAALALADPKNAALFRERPDRAVLRGGGAARDRHRLEALYASVADLNSTRDPAQVVQTLLDRALSALSAERGAVVLARESGALEVVASRQVEPETAADALRLSKTILERASGGEAILTADPGADPRFSSVNSVRLFAIRAVLCVPLSVRQHIVGAMYVDSRDPVRRFDQSDLRFLEALADHAALALENARAFQRLERENLELRAEVGAQGKFGPLFGHSAPMQALFRAIESAAPTGLPVLIVGPSGSGKELAGKAVHRMGPHPEGPFVPVNCAALPESILEGLLFGHEKGAFTGADRARPGLIMQASGGTLFLDEIGDMPSSMQAKLLRVLEEHEVQPLGSTHRQSVDFRLIAATHRDLETEVKEGRFRHDLLYRIDVLRLKIPPLCERLEDLSLLVAHLLRRLEQTGLGPFEASPGLIARLAAWHWPGNVRELENTLSRLALHARGPVLDESVLEADPELSHQFGGARGVEGPARLDHVEREAIRRALEITGGHRDQAAKLLGIGRATLFRKIREFRLEKAGKAPQPEPPGR